MVVVVITKVVVITSAKRNVKPRWRVQSRAACSRWRVSVDRLTTQLNSTRVSGGGSLLAFYGPRGFSTTFSILLAYYLVSRLLHLAT